MVELEETHDFVEICVAAGAKLLVAATSGHGFHVPEDERLAMTRKGKQCSTSTAGEGLLLRAAEGDIVTTMSRTSKMLICRWKK